MVTPRPESEEEHYRGRQRTVAMLLTLLLG